MPIPLSFSFLPSLFLRTKLDVPPLSHRLCTDFAPTLVRRKSEGRTKEERRRRGPSSVTDEKMPKGIIFYVKASFFGLK